MSATLAFQLLNLLHWGGLALLVIGYVISLGERVIHPAMVWGARVQFLLGLALVGTAEAGDVLMLDRTWVAIKLVVALAVVALCEIGRARAAAGRNAPALMHVAFALTVVNVLVALFWR